MCGIIGIISNKDVKNRLIDALTTLEYRGYDSSGIATLNNGKFESVRASGKLKNLKIKLSENNINGNMGIGHIRWATHGKPTVENAHPHKSKKVILVHNGIIENHDELRNELESKGYKHKSQTDSEVIANLIQFFIDEGNNPLKSVQKSLKKVSGAYAISVMFEDYPDYMIAARYGAPLVVGQSNDEKFIGSDSICLANLSKKLCYLEDGDIAEITSKKCNIFNFEGDIIDRKFIDMDSEFLSVSKDGYEHFMLKEIYEQPDAIQRTLSKYIDSNRKINIPQLNVSIDKISRIIIIACGTSYYAGMVAKYWIEDIVKIPVEVDIASEYRYRKSPLKGDELVIFISQSGETADTLAAHKIVKKDNVKTLSIVNVKESSLARESDIVIQTIAGPEIGVASTKAFTNQLLVLLIIASKLSEVIDDNFLNDLMDLPNKIRLSLQKSDSILNIAKMLKDSKNVLFFGRGVSFPISLEGALKLKEISYIHAEAYAAGEMKHGPIALIDENMPVVVIAPFDDLFEKTESNMQEVMARGGKIILISDKDGLKRAPKDVCKIEMPKISSTLSPIIYSIAVQFLAYHTANLRGEDVDQPRNLAKSVTVE